MRQSKKYLADTAMRVCGVPEYFCRVHTKAVLADLIASKRDSMGSGK